MIGAKARVSLASQSSMMTACGTGSRPQARRKVKQAKAELIGDSRLNTARAWRWLIKR